MPNRDDDGALNPAVTTRLVTGILVTGTPSNPQIFTVSSDPRIGGDIGDLNLDTNSGILTRITWNGASWGLPRSGARPSPIRRESHGQRVGPRSVDQHPLHRPWRQYERGCSLERLRLPPRVRVVRCHPVRRPGRNRRIDLRPADPRRRGPTRGTSDQYDPFGGNDGEEPGDGRHRVDQCRSSRPVSGTRSTWSSPTQAGCMRSTTGATAGLGAPPVGEGPGGSCTNDTAEPGATEPDTLHLVTGAGYYGGHANPTRGNTANTFNSSNPQSPVPAANPIECDHLTTAERSVLALSLHRPTASPSTRRTTSEERSTATC